jgi:RNA polymerase sigma-70 factor (ECF subfamily)
MGAFVSQAAGGLPRPLEDYREYLRLLARLQIGPGRGDLADPSDIAQQTLLKAHENVASFRGTTDAQLRAWLRAILAQQLALDARKPGRRGTRIRSLEGALEESSARFEALLVSEESSPSQKELRSERLIALADALGSLPDDQRTALELRYLGGLTVAAVAERMGRSTVSVTGLLYRGTKALRERMGGS